MVNAVGELQLKDGEELGGWLLRLRGAEFLRVSISKKADGKWKSKWKPKVKAGKKPRQRA